MQHRELRVWDPVVRLTHWGLAALIVVDLVNEAGANPWHRWLGYAAGAAILLRLVWGLIGPAHARLAGIARTAGELGRYLTRSGKRTGLYVAHNPLGATMALTLWGLTLAVVVTGWLLQLDRFWGDDFLQSVHAFAAYVLAGLIVVHVAGALVTSARERVNLVKAMITGRKRVAGQ